MSTLTSQRRHLISSSEPVQIESNKNLSLLHRLVMFFGPKNQAISIKIGLEQAKEIQEGKVKAKSFEESIAEL